MQMLWIAASNAWGNPNERKGNTTEKIDVGRRRGQSANLTKENRNENQINHHLR
jgi:hypothetical protein